VRYKDTFYGLLKLIFNKKNQSTDKTSGFSFAHRRKGSFKEGFIKSFEEYNEGYLWND